MYCWNNPGNKWDTSGHKSSSENESSSTEKKGFWQKIKEAVSFIYDKISKIFSAKSKIVDNDNILEPIDNVLTVTQIIESMSDIYKASNEQQQINYIIAMHTACYLQYGFDYEINIPDGWFKTEEEAELYINQLKEYVTYFQNIASVYGLNTIEKIQNSDQINMDDLDDIIQYYYDYTNRNIFVTPLIRTIVAPTVDEWVDILNTYFGVVSGIAG